MALATVGPDDRPQVRMVLLRGLDDVGLTFYTNLESDKGIALAAHPDAAVAFSERQMTDLKVVQDWLETGAQVQSALEPFTLDREGRTTLMLGSYATAELDHDSLLGVVAIQDEAAALASVRDMQHQVGVLDASQRSLDACPLDSINGLAHAGCINEPQRDAAQIDDFFDGVPRGPGQLAHDCAFISEQQIEQARFTDIRCAVDNGAHAFAEHPIDSTDTL